MGNADPDPRARKYIKLNKQTWFPAFQNTVAFVPTLVCFMILPHTMKFIFHIKIQFFCYDPGWICMDPHWFGILDPDLDADPSWDKGMNPDQHWHNADGSLTLSKKLLPSVFSTFTYIFQRYFFGHRNWNRKPGSIDSCNTDFPVLAGWEGGGGGGFFHSNY